MSLWGKGKGLFFLMALIVLSSCKDDLNKIGSNVDQNEYQVYYKEFVIPSSNVLFDSIRTDFAGRFLVGRYNDPELGIIQTTPYIAFHTAFSRLDLVSVVNGDSIISKVTIDSIVFNTSLDYYHYGDNVDVEQSFNVGLHKVNSYFITDNYHFNTSEYEYEPTPLANLTLRYVTDSLDKEDSLYRFSAKLDGQYVEEFKTVLQNNTYPHPFDSAYNKSRELVPIDSTVGSAISNNLFGFALVSDATAKDVIGLNPNGTYLTIHYRVAADTTHYSGIIDFGIKSNFNHIATDRTGSPLDAIKSTDVGYNLDGTRYIQAGTGLMTQLNFDEVMTFMSLQENMIVNSVELAFENVNTVTNLSTPTTFNLFQSTNNFNRTFLPVNGESIDRIYDDSGLPYNFTFNEEKKLYRGIPRRYFQDLYENGITTSSLRIEPSNYGYSLERFTISDGDLRLRFYYSLPNN